MAINKDFIMGYGAGKAAGGGGGDNRNYIEVLEGTMDYPWSYYSYEWIVSAIGTRNMTAYLSFDGTAIGMPGEFVVPVVNIDNGTNVWAYGVMSDGYGRIAMSAMISWYGYTSSQIGGHVDFAVMNSGGVDTDLTAYAPMIPTELTIIYHPLPD